MRQVRGLVLSAVLLGWMGAARADKDRYDVGEVVPAFTLKAVNPEESGEPYVGLDRYYGPNAKEPKKTILLSFFATYCEPCKKEMPLLSALYDTYKDKGLAVLSVSIDKETDKVDFVKTLAKQAGARFPVLTDRFNIVAKRYFINKLPNVYIINSEGKVAMVNVGYNDDISRQMVDEIRKGLGEPLTDPIPDVIAKHIGKGGGTEVAAVEATKPKEEVAAANAPAEKTEADKKAEAEKVAKEKDKGKSKGKAKGKSKGKKKK